MSSPQSSSLSGYRRKEIVPSCREGVLLLLRPLSTFHLEQKRGSRDFLPSFADGEGEENCDISRGRFWAIESSDILNQSIEKDQKVKIEVKTT